MLKLIILAIVGGFSFIYSSFSSDNDNPERDKVIQKTVLGVLEQVHFDPVDLTDEFSSEAFDDYISALDGRKRFFTAPDLESLETYRYLLDDQANLGSLEFFDLSVSLFEKRIDQVEEFYKELLSKPFDFDLKEALELDPDKRNYPANDVELKEIWRKQLKYDVLDELQGELKRQEDEKNKTEDEKKEEEKDSEPFEVKSYDELEKESRKSVEEQFDRWYKNIGKIKRSDRFEVYINAFAHIFDPHSDYYNPKEKQDFDIIMGGKLEGIGARLRTDGDMTKVVSIVPGGPAWKDGQIEVNDDILKVTQKGKDAVDIFGMRIDDVVSMIRGKKGTHVILSVKKKDGKIIDVDIEREVVNIAESFAKSAIINLEDGPDNVGYIHLPKFYSSFDGPEGNSCAIDVAKEIEKLKLNNAKGIILDLRSNGGGSLKDVIDMSGLFIEDGPIVQVKSRDRKPFIYKDEDESVKYTGPLVVLINNFSASASEILAAAMQDYDRAVIVGSHSFGKGTVQRFIDLDRAVRGNTEFKPLGSLKITMQKFFRIDGTSTQLRGVTPDIALPDRYSLIDVGEREYPNAIDWSEITGLEYSQDVFKVNNKPFLREMSAKRIKNNETFQLIENQAKWYKSNREKTQYSLNIDDFKNEIKKQKEEAKEFSGIMKEAVASMTIKSLPEDETSIMLDGVTQDRNENWLKARNRDIYIQEAMYIIGDLIDGAAYTDVNSEKLVPFKKEK